MRSKVKKAFYFHADASSLGGFIEKPFHKHIPAQLRPRSLRWAAM